MHAGLQMRDAILKGAHPVNQEEAIKFAAYQCQIQFGDHNASKHKSGFLEWELLSYKLHILSIPFWPYSLSVCILYYTGCYCNVLPFGALTLLDDRNGIRPVETCSNFINEGHLSETVLLQFYIAFIHSVVICLFIVIAYCVSFHC